MIINFKNYTLTYEELNERLTLVSVEPKFENKDFAEFSVFMKNLYEDKNSELFKFTDSIKIKPLKKTLLESINATYQRNIDSILSQYPSAEVQDGLQKYSNRNAGLLLVIAINRRYSLSCPCWYQKRTLKTLQLSQT